MYFYLWRLLGINTSNMTEYQVSQMELACAYASIVLGVILVVVLIDLLYKVFDRIVSHK